MTEYNMFTYVLYDHPSDRPDDFVVRKWGIVHRELEPHPLEIEILAKSLDEIHDYMDQLGLAFLHRAENDDRCILGCWI